MVHPGVATSSALRGGSLVEPKLPDYGYTALTFWYDRRSGSGSSQPNYFISILASTQRRFPSRSQFTVLLLELLYYEELMKLALTIQLFLVE